MNIELDEVVVLEVSDDALELAAGGAGGVNWSFVCALGTCVHLLRWVSYC